MTSCERVLAAAGMKKADLLPVAPYMGNHCAYITGEKLSNYYTDPQRLAETQLRAWEIYGQDVIVVQSDNYYMAEAFGCRIKYHEQSTPTMERIAVRNPVDVGKLRKPNPETDGRMPVYLEAIRILADQLREDVAIRGCGTGPFVMAGHLMGPEALMIELAKIYYESGGDKQALLALFNLACETLIDFVKLQLEAGATIVQCADSLASLDVISPSMYERYVFPYEKKFFASIKPLCKKYGAVSLLHICGNNTKIFGLFKEVGADIVAVDHKADLGEAKKIMGQKVCLIGNLDPSSVLLRGSPEDVERETRLCIEKAAAGGGYILGSGCEVALHSPVENIKRMIRVAHGFKYN